MIPLSAVTPTIVQGARVELSSGQSMTGGSTTTISWETEVFDDNGMVDIAGNPTRLTVPTGVTRACLNAGIDTASTAQPVQPDQK